jgi:5-aminolevulinate synthase
VDYSSKFDSLLFDLKRDGRYRTFIDLERRVGALPTATWRRRNGTERLVTLWCSNDYLAMGQHPEVLAANPGKIGSPLKPVVSACRLDS